MNKLTVYTLAGKKTTISAPKIFLEEPNMDLLAQAIHVYQSRLHTGSSTVKTRADVDRTKAKWYRQKGTGRARHGARSAPIFVGGGVTHGPKLSKKVLVLPKKMKRKAKLYALSYKYKKHQVFGLSGMSKAKKTSELRKALDVVLKDVKSKNNKFTLVFSEKNRSILKFARNLENVNCKVFGDFNAFDAYKGGGLIFDKDIFVKKKIKK